MKVIVPSGIAKVPADTAYNLYLGLLDALKQSIPDPSDQSALASVRIAKESKPITKVEFSELYKMMAPKDSKMLAALDSVKLDKLDLSIKDLIIFITILCRPGSINEQYKAKLLQDVKELYEFLSHDIFKHLSEYSAVRSHAVSHLLGKLNGDNDDNPIFLPPEMEKPAGISCDSTCRCSKCDSLFILIANIRILISNAQFENRALPVLPHGGFPLMDIPHSSDPESKDTYLLLINKLERHLFIFYAHQVTKHAEKLVLQHFTDGQIPGTVVVIVDYKMKYNPLIFREAQTEYYGKRGFACLMHMFIRLLTPEEQAEFYRRFGYHCDRIVVFMDNLSDGKEGSKAVCSMLELNVRALLRLKGWEDCTEFMLFTDGAGCFNSNFFLMWLTRFYLLVPGN